MLKSNKFLLGLVTALGISSTGFNASAEIVDTFESGNIFYLLETSTLDTQTTNTLYQYDMSAGGTTISSVLTLSSAPTAFTYDGSNFYISAGRELIAYDPAPDPINSDPYVFRRNLITDAKRILDIGGDFIAVILGSPENAIQTINKSTGVEASVTPVNKDDFAAIDDAFFDAANSRIIIKYSEEQSGSQYHTVSVNTGTGALGLPSRILGDAVSSQGVPFFLDDFQMTVDNTGKVVNWGVDPLVFSHGDASEGADSSALSTINIIETDSSIDTATDNTDFVYIAETLDNPCNPIAVGGTRITRLARNGDILGLPNFYYYDTARPIHTITANNTNVFLFYGEGNDLSVEVIDSSDFENPLPWRTETYNPSQSNMSTVSQKLSFSLTNDTTGNVGETIAMQVDDGCDHHIVFWDTQNRTFSGTTETFWPGATEGAYSSALDLIFLAFKTGAGDGEGYRIRYLNSEIPESINENNGARDKELRVESINQMIDAGDYLIVQADAEIGAYTLLAGSLERTATITEANIANCCSAWTGAIYRDGKIYFTTDAGLYSIDFNGDTGAFGTDPAVESPHYGVLEPALSGEVNMAISADGSVLSVGHQLYKTSDLTTTWDALSRDADASVFGPDSIFTIAFDTSRLDTWQFNTGPDDLAGQPTDTDISGELKSILPITVAGSISPLTLSTQPNGALTITVNGATLATLGGSEDSSGGDDSDSDSGGNDGGCNVTNQCVQAPGGGGGGPVDMLLLLGLAGLGVRQLRKHR